MTLQEAVTLISGNSIQGDIPQRWADLGSGDGLFSRALATFLPAGSHILCVDRQAQSIGTSGPYAGHQEPVYLEFRQADFTRLDFSENPFDGFLLANSIHFVNEQGPFLQKLINSLIPSGRLILVEYDTERSNPWVPYPLSFRRLNVMLFSLGVDGVGIQKIGERPSRYHQATLYACEIQAP